VSPGRQAGLGLSLGPGLGRLLLAAALLAGGALAQAAALQPASDAEIVETLPAAGAFAASQRALRRQLARQPRDAATALALSRSLLERARAEGDARLAGQALGALGAWDGDAAAPVELRLQRATLQQHLHDFDAAVAELQALLAVAPRHPQALLTLATVLRVQGRYAESDRACAALVDAGQPLHARACRAENQALRGDTPTARRELEDLLAAAPGQPGWAAWIRTTLGELEQRAGRSDAAVAALRAALQAEPDPYARLALADVLIEARRWPEAQAALIEAGNGDAALLRRAIVAQGLAAPEAAALRAQLAARYAQAAQRPEAAAVHARERARFALEVEQDAPRALVLARANLRTQREAIDLVVLARAARAAGDAAAEAEAVALATRLGLHDARLPAPGGRS
jgi:hypothetical protein